MELVDIVGFGGVKQFGHIQVDHSIITALIE
jgi:hypothetical protein